MNTKWTKGEVAQTCVALAVIGAIAYFVLALLVADIRAEFGHDRWGEERFAYTFTFTAPSLAEQCDAYEKYLRDELAKVAWTRSKPQ